MASRTKQKEEARARRLAEEQARRERERRDRRLRMVGGVVLAAIAVVAVAIAISSGSGSRARLAFRQGPKANATVVRRRVAADGHPAVTAPRSATRAPVTVTDYGDLECPICQDFALGGEFPQLIANEVRYGQGQARLPVAPDGHRERPQPRRVPDPAGRRARRRPASRRSWNYIELFYHEQGTEDTSYVTDTYLEARPPDPGPELLQWNSDRTASTLTARSRRRASRQRRRDTTAPPRWSFRARRARPRPSAGDTDYSTLAEHGDPVGILTARRMAPCHLRRVMIGSGLSCRARLSPLSDLCPLRRAQAWPAPPDGSCIKVQTSEWSKLDGVPVALLGLIGYVGILASLLLPDPRGDAAGHAWPHARSASASAAT